MEHARYFKFFTVGDLLSLGGAVIAVAVSWGSTTAQLRHHGEQLEELRAEVTAAKQLRITPEAEARIRVLESQRAGDVAALSEMKGELARRLDVLEQQNREILQRLPKR